ncbi:MAG: 5-formyltetrahydrofolate cyclo-ligase [Nitriliruptor sp.]|uniref:5-formyltetrahydrofolate cyclo-ligase n=1 Tax=Nitriliruptor sp. TaxID=2448056 RepID=UPI0034A07CD1
MTADGTIDAGGGTEVADVRDRKVSLRRATRRAREELTELERASASSGAVSRLRQLRQLRRARVVAVYAGHGSELDLTDLVAWLRGRGATTALPRVLDERLTLVATTEATPLGLGYRGITEPAGRPIHLSAVDVVVLPGLAFDPLGGRLGQGGGHYDRLLADLPDEVVRIGVCFACQLVPRVPREAHDAAVDTVVTDRATYRTRART